MLDYNPPWEGAAKDVVSFGQGEPERTVKTVLGFWREGGLDPQEVNAVETKQLAIEALLHNKDQRIRLHNDFKKVREDLPVISYPYRMMRTHLNLRWKILIICLKKTKAAN